MGNTASPANKRASSPRRPSVYAPRVARSRQPRSFESEEFEELTRPRTRQPKKAALPRDPTTGRYLPRGQRATAPRARKTVRAASPKRRVEVQVISSPRRQKVEEPRVQFVDEPEVRRSRSPQVLRSSYTRSELEVEEPKTTRTRSVSPARRTQVEAPVSRRDYASPSLASRENQVVTGPSTVRRMKRMATTEVEADSSEVPTSVPPPVERLSTTVPKSDPGQVLFSYLNAA